MLRDTKIAQITYCVHWSFQIELSAAAEAQAIVFFRTTDVGLHKGAVGSQVGAVGSQGGAVGSGGVLAVRKGELAEALPHLPSASFCLASSSCRRDRHVSDSLASQ